MNRRREIFCILAGVLVGFALTWGYYFLEHQNHSRTWEFTLNDLAAQAKAEVEKNGCVSRYLSGQLEEYKAMSFHGFWCGVVAKDTSRFNRAMELAVCS